MVNSAGTVRETKALAKKFVIYKIYYMIKFIFFLELK